MNPTVPLYGFMANGHVPSNDILSLDASFIEVFEHARRLGNALLLTASKHSPDSVAERACHGTDLDALALAYERTQEMQTQFLERLQVAFAATSDEEPTAAD